MDFGPWMVGVIGKWMVVAKEKITTCRVSFFCKAPTPRIRRWLDPPKPPTPGPRSEKAGQEPKCGRLDYTITPPCNSEVSQSKWEEFINQESEFCWHGLEPSRA